MCLIINARHSSVLAVLLTLRSSVRRRRLVAVALIGVRVAALLFMTRFGDIFLQRIAKGYQQNFIRFDIWRHTLELAAQNSFFGWGLDEQLRLSTFWVIASPLPIAYI